MHANTRKLLDQIDEFLTTAPLEEAKQLWDVLSALRGPDEPRLGGVKEACTIHIRQAAFPKFAAAFTAPHSLNNDRYCIGPTMTTDIPFYTEGFYMGSHLRGHILYAAYALGLIK